MYQVMHLTEVPTRLETVVKFSGSTCCRAMRDRLRQQSGKHQLTAANKRREAVTRANVGPLAIIISRLDIPNKTYIKQSPLRSIHREFHVGKGEGW